ncbi:MAG: prefoldin subunit alpha [Nanobdellota archaeon]
MDYKEKYKEMQQLDESASKAEEQMKKIEEQIDEVMYNRQSLDEFKQIEPGNEILVPISNGIFAKAELKDNKNLKVNVGSGTVVGKDVEEAKKLLDEQMRSLRKYKDEMREHLDKIVLQMQTLEKEVDKSMKG